MSLYFDVTDSNISKCKSVNHVLYIVKLDILTFHFVNICLNGFNIKIFRNVLFYTFQNNKWEILLLHFKTLGGESTPLHYISLSLHFKSHAGFIHLPIVVNEHNFFHFFNNFNRVYVLDNSKISLYFLKIVKPTAILVINKNLKLKFKPTIQFLASRYVGMLFQC